MAATSPRRFARSTSPLRSSTPPTIRPCEPSSSSGSAKRPRDFDVVTEGRDQGSVVFPRRRVQNLSHRRRTRTRRAALPRSRRPRRTGFLRRSARRPASPRRTRPHALGRRARDGRRRDRSFHERLVAGGGRRPARRNRAIEAMTATAEKSDRAAGKEHARPLVVLRCAGSSAGRSAKSCFAFTTRAATTCRRAARCWW